MTSSTKPSPLAAFGVVPAQYDASWYSSFIATLTRRLNLLAGPQTVQPQLLLQAPNGTVYQITISNAGSLTATAVTRGTVKPPL